MNQVPTKYCFILHLRFMAWVLARVVAGVFLLPLSLCLSLSLSLSLPLSIAHAHDAEVDLQINEPLSNSATKAVNTALQSLAEQVASQKSNPRAADSVTRARTVLLRSASVAGNIITINLSREITDYSLGSDDFEAALKRIHFEVDEALGNDLARRHGGINYVFQIEGVALSEFFAETKNKRVSDNAQLPTATTLLSAKGDRVLNPVLSQPAISMAGRRVTISAGHGYYKNEQGAWVLQRDFIQNIVEDFVNAEMIMYLNTALQQQGVIVRATRNLDKAASNGISGFPKWQESAREHIRSLGIPASVWDSSTADINDDIRCRPLYANWIDNNGYNTDLIVSLHNNGGGGTGTETLYDTDNGFGIESKRLADVVHAKVIAAIRANYNANWVDRGVKGFAGSYGENRLATRPAIIIETAFMDRPQPDNAALQDERYKKLVADAIAAGIADYYVNFSGDTEPPTAPVGFGARGMSETQIKLTWNPSTDNTGVTGYNVLRDGALLARVVGASATPSYVDTMAVSGITYRYTVTASDAAGNVSLPSQAVAVKAPAPIPMVTLAKRGGIDMDGDGKSKLVLRASDVQATQRMLAGRLVNNQFVFTNLLDPGANFRLVGTTDYDGNGKSDLVFQNMSTPGELGEVRAWNDFLPSNDRRIRDVKRVWDVQAVGDLDGDGLGDLVWRYVVADSPDTGVSYIWFTNTNANTNAEPIVRKRGGAPLSWQLAGAADLNGDGAADMVYISPTIPATPTSLPTTLPLPSVIRVLMATPNRTCANLSAGNLPLNFSALKLADFTGARRGDLLIRNDMTGAVSLLSLNAVGLDLPPYTADPTDRNASCTASTLVVDATLVELPMTDASWKFYAAGDFNGDGVTDVVWLRPDGTLTVWLMSSATAAPQVIPNAGIAPIGYGVFQP